MIRITISEILLLRQDGVHDIFTFVMEIVLPEKILFILKWGPAGSVGWTPTEQVG